MTTDKRDKSGKSGGESAAGSEQKTSSSPAPGAASAPGPASAPSEARVESDPTAAIAGIESIKSMALSAPNGARTTEAIAAIRALAASAPGAMSAAIEAIKELGTSTASVTQNGSTKKRAICLGGGGPAAGLHIGALRGLKDHGIEFNNDRSVWALSCIGAWVGIIYNQAAKGKEFEETYNFFRDVFRDDETFKSFPTNTVFTPDWLGNAKAMQDFLLEPDNYRNAILPRKMMESLAHTLSFLGDRKNWSKFSEGDFNRWTLNHVLAVNPAVRFLTALAYKSEVDGRSRLFYQDSKFLKDIKFKELDKPTRPFLFHNAFSFAKEDIVLFANNSPRWGRKGHKEVSAESLCACSALPFIEQTVKVDGETYCEGALVDTVNFYHLLKDHNHPDQGDALDEIWVNRLLDIKQIHPPKNLYDALANLCQLFAATVGEDDVKLFKHHVHANNRKQDNDGMKWHGILVEIKVDRRINYEWSHSNLDAGCNLGKAAADAAAKLYNAYKHRWKPGQVLMIPDDLSHDDIKAVLG
jgi:predicted acylesterase/phospholipase RssA